MKPPTYDRYGRLLAGVALVILFTCGGCASAPEYKVPIEAYVNVWRTLNACDRKYMVAWSIDEVFTMGWRSTDGVCL